MTKVAEKRKTCFVVGPIGSDASDTRTNADWLLWGIIQPVFKEHFEDFEVLRSDTITAPGMIDVQMITHLINADLVIADMSELNPNAFYEMGIRHMTSKPIVHMFEAGTRIPFDVASYRAIEYKTEKIGDLEVAKERLRGAIAETLKPDYKVQNPVIRAIGVQAFEQKASPEMQVIYEEIAAIGRKLGTSSSFPQHDGGDARISYGPPLNLKTFTDIAFRTGRGLVNAVLVDRMTPDKSKAPSREQWMRLKFRPADKSAVLNYLAELRLVEGIEDVRLLPPEDTEIKLEL